MGTEVRHRATPWFDTLATTAIGVDEDLMVGLSNHEVRA